MRSFHKSALFSLFSLTAGAAVFSCLVCIVGVILILPDESIPYEQQRIIKGLENGAYSRFEQISPAPISVNEEGDQLRLVYNIGKSRILYIYVDKQLRFINYYIYHD